MQDAHLAETEQTLIPIHPQHQQRQRQNQQFEGGENFDYYVDRKTDGGITETHGETRRQHLHLHLQLRSGQLRNGKRDGAHGNLHHLRNGGDFGFLERTPEIDGECRQYTHKHCTCSAIQPVHKRGTHITRLAQGPTWLSNCSVIFVRLKRVCHLVRTCLTLCCSRICLVRRAHHLPHSLFLLPRHRNTHYNRDNTIYSKNTHCIINLSKNARSKSIAVKNHSGVKNLQSGRNLRTTFSTPSPGASSQSCDSGRDSIN